MAIKTLTKFEMDMLRLLENLPQNTVVILANVEGHKLSSVLTGRDKIKEDVRKDAAAIYSYADYDGDENK